MGFFRFSPDDQRLIKELRSSGDAALDPRAKTKMRLALQRAAARVTNAGKERYKGQNEQRGFFSFIFIQNPMIGLLIALVLIGSGLGTAVAANNAKPGDKLFGVDRALEQVGLKLEVRDASRARLSAAIADEREAERKELEGRNRPAAEAEAAARSEAALDQAIDSLTDVHAKLLARGNTKAAAAVNEALQKLQQRNDDRDDRDEDTLGLTEAEAKVFPDHTLVKIEFNDRKDVFTISERDEAAIVAAIQNRTKLTEADIRAVLKIETENDDEDRDDDGSERGNENENENANRNTNENGNRNGNGNTNTNRNTNANENRNTNANTNVNTNTNANTNDDDNTEEREIKVRVKDGRAEIETRLGTSRQDWTLNTSDQSLILADIAARTGLTTATIQSIWEYEKE